MSSWGKHIHISIFGESHGAAIGVVIDGLPAGETIDLDALLLQMARRAPGRDKAATPRSEADTPEFLSGLLNGTTTGAPLCAVIRNTNTRSQDYGNVLTCPRPSHADYTGYVRYGGFNDLRGGGHFSGRLTAPMVLAGAIARQLLARKGVRIAAHIASVGTICDQRFDPINLPDTLMEHLSGTTFGLIDPTKEAPMRDLIEDCRRNGDSIGGTIECAVTGMPAGVGSPMFEGVENILSSLLFGIPAVKGVEFGAGFDGTQLRGSQHNDAFCYENGTIRTKTNHNGGILGGITSGMPILFRVAIKPTPSIAQEQSTVDLQNHCDTTLTIKGRHDPCIVVRAVPVVEAAAALAMLDLLMEVHT